MKDQSLINISLPYFKSRFPEASSLSLGDDFYIMDAALKEYHNPLYQPCRFDGFMICYCVNGTMKMSVNLTEIELSSGMIYMNVPGNIIRLNEIVGGRDQDIRVLCMALTKDFFHGLNVEVCKLFNEGLSMLEKPCMQLSDKDFQLIDSLIRYIINLLQMDVLYKKEAVLSALSSLFYILIGAWTSDSNTKQDNELSNRSKVIFDKFMRLVMEYHTQYRNVGFYADQLCLTPKYLSKLIKNATGRSAPEWIDSYVILEAKNLLKYSGTTIKEIVFKLNFPNQSVFYKFFKAHTGMTPTEYRNS